MKNNKITKASKSKRPFTSLYASLPKNKREDFRRFARVFGFTATDIANLLSKETKD